MVVDVFGKRPSVRMDALKVCCDHGLPSFISDMAYFLATPWTTFTSTTIGATFHDLKPSLPRVLP